MAAWRYEISLLVLKKVRQTPVDTDTEVAIDSLRINRVSVWKGLCDSSPVQFILFNFANNSPSITMEIKVSKEITGTWQNQRSETNKNASWTLFLKLQAAGINFEKLLGWTVFKNPNFNPFQFSSVLSIRGICCFCYGFKLLFLCFS